MDPRPSTDDADQHGAPDDAPPLEVDVARTGGFAGITRRWSAQPPPDEADEWLTLIDRCPWDAASAVDDGETQPDTFTWCIRANRHGALEREAELPDDEVTGAWLELIDAVRAWNRASGRVPADRPLLVAARRTPARHRPAGAPR